MATLKRLLFLFCIALFCTWILRTFFFDTISVASGSMEPTLNVGTHYLVNRFVYYLHSPQRGDIISFVSPVDHQSLYVKRVIAIGGDKISIENKRVILNGQPLDEPYAVHNRPADTLIGDNLGPLTVPEDSTFVLGDDRDESYDSSVWVNPQTNTRLYFLPVKNIRGRLMQLT